MADYAKEMKALEGLMAQEDLKKAQLIGSDTQDIGASDLNTQRDEARRGRRTASGIGYLLSGLSGGDEKSMQQAWTGASTDRLKDIEAKRKGMIDSSTQRRKDLMDKYKLMAGLEGKEVGRASQHEYAKKLHDYKLSKKLSLGEELTGKDKRVYSTKLRKELNNKVAGFSPIQNSYKKIKAFAKNPSAASDLGLIFNYMKMLDKNSVVRESEFKNAAQARAATSRLQESGVTVPAFLVQTVQKLKTGELLLPKQRKDFLNAAGLAYKAEYDNIQPWIANYKGISDRYGLDFKDINMAGITDLTQEVDDEEESQTTEQKVAGAIDKGLETAGDAIVPSAEAGQAQGMPDFANMSDEELKAYIGGQ